MLELVSNPLAPPKLIEYDNYRLFMRDFYKYKKSMGRGFSFRRFSQLAGVKSSNYLMLVMSGQRNLSPAVARAVTKAMKLTKYEADLFVALVKIESSSNEEERVQAEKERRISIKNISAKSVPQEKAEYLSVWYYSLVRELAFLPDFKPNAIWISKKLRGMISEAQAERAIEILIKLGLWRIQDKKILVSDIFLDTGSEDIAFASVNVAQIHSDNLVEWSKIVTDTTVKERELGLLHIPIDSKKIPELKKRIQAFQDEIIGWLQDEKQPNQLVQLGTYLIPVTKVHEE